MRLSSSIICALPALAAAQQQIPFLNEAQEWFEKIRTKLPSPGSPLDAGAAKVADHVVVPLTMHNFWSVLSPKPDSSAKGPEEWWVFVTGGNKTCFGTCTHAETAWNESVAILTATPNKPNLAVLNCETEPVLCNSMAAGPPSLWHLQLPVYEPNAQTPGPTTVRYLPVNRTTITASDFVTMHKDETWKNVEPYEGMMHPFDSILAKTGVNIPLGYFIWFFALLPSWTMMILISMGSRTFMGRRMNRQQPAAGAPAAGARRT